ncbi:uncharacterized protein LOC135817484 [Sycon ciliatum]|uniref:uncharacterized protein LOC135817484 n=1 Tax=Sycon ciliatum TaxID=27933 RepID=UPI0020AA6430|eukprot:scpid89525/ scgid24289/ 
MWSQAASVICSACRARLGSSSGLLSRYWVRESQRNASTRSTKPANLSTPPSPPTTSPAPQSAARAQAEAMRQSFNEPAVLFKLRRDRFKFYYLGLLIGLIPIPLYYQERMLMEGKVRVKAREEARARVLKEPLPEAHEHAYAKYDDLILNAFLGLGVLATTLVVALSFRIVTKWKYDFKAKTHYITTFSPIFRQRSFSVPDNDVLRLADFKNRARIKLRRRPMAFMLDLSGGSKPNVQLYNIVLGSGHGSS